MRATHVSFILVQATLKRGEEGGLSCSFKLFYNLNTCMCISHFFISRVSSQRDKGAAAAKTILGSRVHASEPPPYFVIRSSTDCFQHTSLEKI